jgi:hypothetical protein
MVMGLAQRRDYAVAADAGKWAQQEELLKTMLSR